METPGAEVLKSQVQREFAARADAYVKSVGHASGDDLARLVELAQVTAHTVALDVATGGGHTALALAGQARLVVASDLALPMLQSAAAFIQGRGNVCFSVADAEALPFADGSFDLVTCRIAPHHFPDVGQAVREWARVLRPGGRVTLEDSVVPDDAELDSFMNTLERIRDYTHGRSYTEREWRAFFHGAGLEVLHTETWSKDHPFQDWMERGAMLDSRQDWQHVEEMLRAASPEAQAAFGIKLDESGTPLVFADQKLILIARKAE